MESRGTKVILALQRWARWCANCVAPRHDSANETGNKKCLANGPASDENLHRPAPTLPAAHRKLSFQFSSQQMGTTMARFEDQTSHEKIQRRAPKIEPHLPKQGEKKTACPWSMPAVARLKKGRWIRWELLQIQLQPQANHIPKLSWLPHSAPDCNPNPTSLTAAPQIP